MVSVATLVSSWVKNVLLQKQSLDNFKEELSFFNDFEEKGDFSFAQLFASGVLIKTEKNLFSWWFSYFWESYLSGAFCEADSDFLNTKHLFSLDFIPFEGEWGDFFSGKSFSSGWVEIFPFESRVSSFTGEFLMPLWGYIDGNNIFISDAKAHVIWYLDAWDTSTPAKKVVGTGKQGELFSPWASGTGIFLNTPTGLAWSGNMLFISDTLNNRILYFDRTTNNIYLLLDEKDGIKEPTGIFYDDTEKSLYIANSGAWEILKYSSKSVWNPAFKAFTFSPTKDISFNNFSLQFLDNSGTKINLTPPTNTGSVSFSGIIAWEDFARIESDDFEYYFTSYLWGEVSVLACLWAWNYIYSWNPVKCTASGTWVIWNLQTKKLFTSSNYEIELDNLTWSFLCTGSYIVELNFFDNSSLVYKEIFPFFTNGDDDILTKWDNTLEVIFSSGSFYPTGIYKKSGGDILVNDFISRKSYKIQNDNSLSNTWNLLAFDFDFLSKNIQKNIFKSPLKEIEFDYNSNILTLSWAYFKYFSCYNEDERKEKSFLLKKGKGD